MPDIWVISDTHFGHENIIGYCHRPFYNIYDMNETMIERWNSVVKPEDKVYHLGDVYMGSQKYAAETLPRLNGKKRLILGNHDDGKDKLLHIHFQKISMWRMFREFGLLLTHVPVSLSTLSEGKSGQGKPHKEMTNIHGHIHTNPSPKGPYRCVCVEQPEINYTPINIEQLRTR